LAIEKCTFGEAENGGQVQPMGSIRKLNSSDRQPMRLSCIMGYGKHKIHKKMSDPKHPMPIHEDDPTHNKSLWGGDVLFQKGPDCDRLFALIEAHGWHVQQQSLFASIHTLTSLSLIA
jgi:hypothetical protein